ncbi:MAG: ABC transporter ATP-binding protein [Faecousia sp.]
MENEPIIAFQDFGFQYTAQAEPTLYHINLEIRKGEKILIAGPSGCGKSTIAHCINGLIPNSYPGKATGKLTIAGKNAMEQGLFELSKTVGTVLQDSDGQFIGLTVAEDIAFALENDCVPVGQMHDTVAQIAELVDVSQVLHHAPHEISGGQKQRVGLGGVMVGNVDVLLFDEPLANLDPATGKQAVVLIDEIQKRTGCAVVIIEHRVEDVLYRPVDRIVLMEEGRIRYDGDPDTLLCTDLLPECGIREPLYVTALKYAGVTLRPDMRPSYLPELKLSEEQKQQVCSWFAKLPESEEQPELPVLLRAEAIDFTYEGGHHALRGITANVHRGEMLSIVGTNGAGKSTFSKVICGFEKAQSGILELNGIDLSSLSIKERADHIGYVMQNPNQMISKTQIFDEVALGLRNRDVAEEEIRPQVEEALKICGLYPYRNWPVSALSYGQKKRVTIASILVLKPEMILLDEPTAGQDLRHYTEIMEFLCELNRQGITVVLITHDMHLMLEYTPRAIVFHNGQVIADMSAAQVLNSPEIVEQAHLKETSLYHLSAECGISDAEEFTRRFIAWDREVRK